MSSMADVETKGHGFVHEALHNRRLLGVALIAAIGGFLFGYDTGVIGGALLFMQKDLGLDTSAKELTVAILLLGAVTGALIAGWAADRFSRRRTKIVSGSPRRRAASARRQAREIGKAEWMPYRRAA